MKHKFQFMPFLFMALAISQNVMAYDFSAVAPTGQTIYFYFDLSNTSVHICCPSGLDFNYDSTYFQPWGNGYRYPYTEPVGDLVIPDSITYMGVKYPVHAIDLYAFAGCRGLTSVTIPNSVTSIGHYAFFCCDSLTSVSISNSVTNIGKYAFEDCTELASIQFGNKLKRIGHSAFAFCTNIDTLIIPDSVTTIESEAFNHCSGLNYLVIGKSVASIGVAAFSNCINLTTIIFNADSCQIAAGYEGSTQYRAFNGCTNVTSFTIGNNVRIIPPFICYWMTNLTNVVIPQSVSYIGELAFAYSGLTSVVFNADSCTYAGGDDINREAFFSCDSINSFIFGNSVKVIPDRLCRNKRALTSVTIPDGVTYIGKGAFASCENIASPIIIPGSVTEVGQSAFAYCINLPSVTLSNGINSIGCWAFSTCMNLSSVIIPQSIDSIGDRAFYYCTSLESVYLPEIPPAVGANSFRDRMPQFIYDGCVMLNNYHRHPDWQNYYYYFHNTAESIIVNVMANDSIRGRVSYRFNCDSSVTISAHPNTGYRFDHWSTGSTSSFDTVYLTGDTTITAYFVPDGGTEGIAGAEQSPINVWVKDRHIIVDGVKNEQILIFDIMGRRTANENLPKGVYLVKVGNNPARKVVVIR